MAIRSWGATWRIQVLFSLLGEAVCEASNEGSLGAQLKRYSKFLDYVYEQKLQDAHLLKLILNGWVIFAPLFLSLCPFLESKTCLTRFKPFVDLLFTLPTRRISLIWSQKEYADYDVVSGTMSWSCSDYPKADLS